MWMVDAEVWIDASRAIREDEFGDNLRGFQVVAPFTQSQTVIQLGNVGWMVVCRLYRVLEQARYPMPVL